MTTRPPTAPAEPLGPVGVADIVRRLGVRPGTVHAWVHRDDDFPIPRWVIGGQRLYAWESVQAWAEATGRA